MAILVTDKENLGKISRTPDEGWRRIDSSHEYIMPYGDNYVSIGNVNAVEHWENKAINFLRGYVGGANFAFYGTKLKFVGPAYDGWGNPHTVIIDGEKYKLYCNAGSNPSGVVNFTTHFEITGLKNRIHKVELIVDGEPTNTGYQSKYKFDCIDIDADGYMCPSLITNYEFPVKVGNAEDVESFAGTLVSGEEQLLITREGGLFITDGMGGYTQCGGSGSNDAKDIVFDNSNTEIVSDNVQDALKEVFQCASNGKELISTAIAGKGFSVDRRMSFTELAERVDGIPVAPATFNGATPMEVICGEDNLKAGDVVKIINQSTSLNSIDDKNIKPILSTEIIASNFSENGDYLVCFNLPEKAIKVYEVDQVNDTFTLMCSFPSGSTNTPTYVDISPDGNYIVACITHHMKIYERTESTYKEVFAQNLSSSSYLYQQAQFLDDDHIVYSSRGATGVFKFDRDKYTLTNVCMISTSATFTMIDIDKKNMILHFATRSDWQAYKITPQEGGTFSFEKVGSASFSSARAIASSPSGEFFLVAFNTTVDIYKYNGFSFDFIGSNGYHTSFAFGITWANDNSVFTMQRETGLLDEYVRNGDYLVAQPSDPENLTPSSGYANQVISLPNKYIVTSGRYGISIYKINKDKGLVVYKVTDTSYVKNCEGVGMLTVDGNMSQTRIVNKFLERNSDIYYTEEEVVEIVNDNIISVLSELGITDTSIIEKYLR